MWLRMVIFLTVFTGVLAGLHYYIWLRLFRDPNWAPPTARVAGIVLVVLCLSTPLGFLLRWRLGRSLLGAVALVPLIWIGVAFLLFVAALGSDLVRLCAWATAQALGWWRGSSGPEDAERRELLRRGLAGAALLVSAGATASGVRSALGEVGVREVPVRLARLPPTLEGLTIVQISDLHVGLTVGLRFVEAVVEKMVALRPDVVAITGDLVDGSVAELAERVAPLSRLAAATRFGAFFVAGNHDHYSGLQPWLEHVQRLGMRPLQNERVSIGDGGGAIDLAGIDDYSGRPDLGRALAGCDPQRELVLLAHQPRAVAAASRAGVGLQLSGHTHGGQIWPFGAVVALTQPYVAGLHRHGEHTQIYVSCGTGYWGPPLRLRAPAEITRIVLSR
jgi:predicted MPP superfamily phosphohydrolase